MFDLLTNEEKQRPYAYLMKYPAAKMPKNIHHLLNHRPSIEPLPFSKKTEFLQNMIYSRIWDLHNFLLEGGLLPCNVKCRVLLVK